VDLDISRDSGVNWEPVAHGIVQEELSWTVTPPAATKCLIRVRSSTGFHSNDVSNKLFTITTPTVDVETPDGLPVVAAFAAPFPNPAHGGTRFRLALPVSSDAHLALYDVAGRRVRTLVEGPLGPGRHDVPWDGTDDGGRRLGAGVYFARATWSGFTAERRVVLLP
jgi:hypothetical protein